MPKKSKHVVAQSIGRGLAYVQDTIDVAVGWGFHKLKSTKIESHDHEEEHKTKAKRAANAMMGFLGELGDSFYSEYERIKQERKNKQL